MFYLFADVFAFAVSNDLETQETALTAQLLSSLPISTNHHSAAS